jgi:phage terminase small subunit
MGYEDLTGKRRLFVDAYIGQANCCKAAAARIAGYACPGQEGYRLYQDPEVRAAIDERLRERSIPPEEILARLSEQARGNMA